MNLVVRNALKLGLYAATIGSSSQALAQFTPGNVVVLQVGDGSAALSSAANPVFLREYAPATAGQTTPVFSVTVPTTGASSRFVLSGSATSEGALSLSADSLKLVFAGYDTATGFAAVNSSAAASVARVIDTVSILGVAGRAAATTTAFSANNIRAAAKGAGENYWAVGANTGIAYLGTASAAATVFSATTNLRFLQVQNGKLYFSTSSGLSRIGRINSQPTSGTATADTMITLGAGTTPSPYGFAINGAETIAYVADDRTNGAGGIQKWTLNNGTWSIADTLVVGATTIGARGLAVNWSGTYPVLFATTTDNKLVRVVDSSFAAGVANTPVVLATASANTAFRGVSLAPRCTPPAAVATAGGATTFCTGGSVTLTASTGTGLSYQWYNGSTAIAGATAATYNATTSGSYAVQVSSGGGCSATSAPVAVTVNTPPTATVAASGPTTFCQGGSVTLSVPTSAGYTYQWYNGTTALATTASLVVTASGSYTVTVSAGSGASCSATSAVTAVTVNPAPTATITAGGATTFCTGGSVVLSANTGTGLTYQWYNGTTLLSNTAATLTASTAGSYTVNVTNTNGCSATSAATVVTVNTPPTATITASGPTTFCQGGSVVLNAPTGTGYTYQWFNGPTAVAATASISVNTSGTYTVTVSAGASTSCSATSPAATVVTVNAAPTAAITPTVAGSNDTVFICPAGSVVLNASAATSGTSYQWTLNGTAIAGATANSYTASQPGAYRLSVTNASACAALSVALNVVRDSIPTLTTTSLPTVCAGDSTVMSVFPTLATTYQWQKDGVDIPGAQAPTYAAKTSGTYNAILTHTNASGSCAFATAGQVIVVNPLPQPVAQYANGVLSVSGAYTSYSWNLNGTAISGATASTYTPTANGAYSVTVDSNSCSATSAAVSVSGLGVTPVSMAGIRVFPNPAADRVQVVPAGIYTARVTDVQGRVLLQVANAGTLDVLPLTDGLYFIALSQADGTPVGTVRIVKAGR